MSIKKKEKELAKIAKEIKKCKICQKSGIGKAVPGEGNPNAKIIFIGEAPGKEEAKTGRPFIGRSGKLLRSLIREIGLKESGVYITSPVKYLPKSGTPTEAEIIHGKKYLQRQIAVINPKIVVLLGRVAYKAFFEDKSPVIANHGKIIEKDNRKYFLTIHPAAALRFPKFRKIIKSDFQKLKEII